MGALVLLLNLNVEIVVTGIGLEYDASLILHRLESELLER